MTKATLREKNKNGGRTKKKCVGSSVRCWLNLSIEERISVVIPVKFKAWSTENIIIPI